MTERNVNDFVWFTVADNASFVPFLQSVRRTDIVIAVTFDEASQM